MEQLIEFGLFIAKLVAVLAFIAVLLALISGMAMKMRRGNELEFENLNDRITDLKKHLVPVAFSKKAAKRVLKDLSAKEEKFPKDAPKLFILDFKGDITARQVDELRDEVTALLTITSPGDEVLARIESPGGTVHGYGLAAAQLLRLKNANVQLTASIDKVAASGGYLMAATANKIIAAPFAIVGSIGVVAQVPNFNRLLKKHDVDYEEITAGEFKRTISLFGEITEKGRKKFVDQIEDVHQLFKEFVSHERPQVLMDQVATGEYWFGRRAVDMRLVDEIKTSDEYIFEKRETHRLLKLKIHPKRSLSEKLSEAVHQTLRFRNFNSGIDQGPENLKF